MKSNRDLSRALASARRGAGGASGAACRQDMHNGPGFSKPLRESDFYDDKRSERQLIEDTVPRGWLMNDDAFATGKVNGQFVSQLPMPLTRELLERGQNRFNIYCTPCHAKTGLGDGMVVRRGYKQPPSYLDPRLRAQPVGYFYDVISHGFGQMPDYAAQIQPQDRWAVAAYVRALQIAQHATVADVPEQDRPKLEEQPAEQAKPAEGQKEGQKEGAAAHE
jgi:mono/diheme cytochrome c family protein